MSLTSRQNPDDSDHSSLDDDDDIDSDDERFRTDNPDEVGHVAVCRQVRQSLDVCLPVSV